ncbi:MAG: FecR domain-containing protein [Bacteroidia bacterium]|nr:FecR domain-containing protein [Bacteroidia bacterium]NNF81741.1 FecR family protein [Flavobacteriaceae bacterium]NNK69983.1 FecR family protein [Flavobacteriaceae bacterium]
MKQDDLLYKWLNDQLSEAEFEEFKQREDYAQNLEILKAANAFKAGQNSSVSDFQSFKSKYEKRSKPSGRVINMPVWLRVAAVLVISLGLYFTFFNSGDMTVSTLAGEKTMVSLPDDSEVHVNALSQIIYNPKNWKNKRAVDLDGEAYFKVAKGQTFDVITDDGVVTVLGTQFNVKQRLDFFEVKCFEGLVRVSSDQFEEKLPAGNVLRIINGELTLSTTDSQIPTWIEGFSRFDEVPLMQVIDELKRQYGVEVSLNSVNTNRLFSGRFTHNDLEKALLEVTSPMDLTYELNGSTIQIHGN